MSLTNKDKQFITLNYPQKNSFYIANKLKKPVTEIDNYIKLKSEQTKTTNSLNKEKISGRLENLLYFFIFALIIVILYFRGLNNDFVSDDREVIIDLERYIKSGEFLWMNPFSILRNVQYVLAYQIAGLTPFFYRIFNIIFHIGFAYMTFKVMKRFVNEKYMAFILAVFVAVHPIMVESVAWISGGPYAQSAFFTMISFYYFLKFKDQGGKKNFIVSLIFYLIGVSSSEKNIVFPIILFVYEIAFGNLKKSYKSLIPYFAISLFWLWVALQGLSARLDYLMLANGTDQRFNFINPFVQIPAALASYFHLFIWPDRLSLYQSDISLTPFTIFRNSLVTLLFFGFILYFYKRNKVLFFWLSFFFISLLVTLNPFGLSWVFAERYAYFGSIGIYFVLVYGIFSLFRFLNLSVAKYVFLTVIILALSVRTFIRIGDWTNEETLWTATAKYSKTDAKSHNNLGHVLAQKGDVQGAATSFQKAISLSPGYADPYHNLANIYLQVGDFDQAEQIFLKAIELNPNLWQSNQNLGSIYLQRKQYETATLYFEKVKKIKPDYYGSYMGLGMVAFDTGQVSKSVEMFKKALELDPTNSQAKEMLAKTEAIE